MDAELASRINAEMQREAADGFVADHNGRAALNETAAAGRQKRQQAIRRAHAPKAEYQARRPRTSSPLAAGPGY